MNRVSTWAFSLAAVAACDAAEALSGGRFLTRRIDYFRATAPSHANEQKSEWLDIEDLTWRFPCKSSRKQRFLPLFGENRCDFSSRKCPWSENSVPWIAISMGCCRRSVPWIAASGPCAARFVAKRRAGTGVRFNGLPNSAHAFAGRKGGVGRRAKGHKKESGARPRRAAFPTSERKKNLSCKRARRPAAGYGLRTSSSPSSSCKQPGCFRA